LNPVWSTAEPSSPALTDSARAVLKTIAVNGPATRPQLSALLRFSKPTMSAAVTELERYGLPAPTGVNRGQVGRTSVSYGLGPNAGYVIGIDCGTTQVHAIARGLDGSKLAEVAHPLDDRSGKDRFQTIETVIAELLPDCAGKATPLRAIAIALPNIISPSIERLPDRDTFIAVLERLKDDYGVPVRRQAPVNCSRLSSARQRRARSSRNMRAISEIWPLPASASSIRN